ncbi:hypothetical protein VB776_22165 [Arcicella sp. DC2W]|uniref:Uncharacterized protein n=1 Tax=Arcicella gelida TaxID=2984195 RepID=A0ABU5SB77_9BACT|nr:hypothetical protein [Arcicella sp. DC2W]MEA5405660.1 hypothetical protein [Arcicella sp. DC2W]
MSHKLESKILFSTAYFSCLETRKVTKEIQEIPKLAPLKQRNFEKYFYLN